MKAISTAIAATAFAASSTMAEPPNVQLFTDSGAFSQFCATQGKTQKNIETFEESDAPLQAKLPFPNPLQNGVPRPGFPTGIDATNLIIQTNITPGPHAPTPNPSGDDRALWVNGAGFIGSNSIKVGTDEFLYNRFSSLDLIFTSHDKTGVGFDVSTFTGFNSGHAGFNIAFFSDANILLGTGFVPAAPAEPTKSFFGVWSPVPIGRVNIWGIFDMPQPFAVDNIQMWSSVPAPGASVLLGIGGLVALRRRR